MKAAVYHRNGDPDVLCFEEIADPEIAPTTVLIRVAYVGLQGGDIYNRRNTPPRAGAPHVVGYQAAGTVEAVGEQVTSVRPGDRVAGFAFAGSHAELFGVDQQHVYPLPEGLDFAVAAALPVEFGTASDGLFEFGRLKAGETVLVRGATGGVGIAAVQLAHRAGATVIAVAATAERLLRVSELGATHVIDYRNEDVVARARELTDGRGVDLVLDVAGGAPLLGACAFKGRYGLVGAASGVTASVTFEDLLTNGLTVFSFMFGREMGTDRVRRLIADLMRRAADGELSMPVEKVFALSDAAQAHAFVERGRPLGRVLLKARG
ncbi:quinone oxidoreductase family protein [Hyalangium minutum]|uniref:quinone oxidoreductase family protein n=1 Tax=Hyalangium minutum TaxID=394096 RepID=UPI0005C5EA2A|nr:zinc-binding dehydrogenase [Hyalangium minutum]